MAGTFALRACRAVMTLNMNVKHKDIYFLVNRFLNGLSRNEGMDIMTKASIFAHNAETRLRCFKMKTAPATEDAELAIETLIEKKNKK